MPLNQLPDHSVSFYDSVKSSNNITVDCPLCVCVCVFKLEYCLYISTNMCVVD